LSAETEEVLEAIEHGLTETLKLSRILGLSKQTSIRDAIEAIDGVL
jgi:hypothetical protein